MGVVRYCFSMSTHHKGFSEIWCLWRVFFPILWMWMCSLQILRMHQSVLLRHAQVSNIHFSVRTFSINRACEKWKPCLLCDLGSDESATIPCSGSLQLWDWVDSGAETSFLRGWGSNINHMTQILEIMTHSTVPVSEMPLIWNCYMYFML